jgi:transcription elongation GreA/GreB family factor
MSDQRESAALSDQTRDRIITYVGQLRQRRDHMTTELDSDHHTVGHHGDAAEAIQRADEVARINAQIADLNRVLQGGRSVVDKPGLLPDGTQLTLRFPDSGVVHMSVVAIEAETSDGASETALTADSPMGLAMVGHQPGDTVTFTAPQGRHQVELLGVKYPD